MDKDFNLEAMTVDLDQSGVETAAVTPTTIPLTLISLTTTPGMASYNPPTTTQTCH